MEAVAQIDIYEEIRTEHSQEIQILNELQLAMVGGGIGDVVFG